MSEQDCALYLRLSDDKKKTGENVEDQRAGTTALAARMGLRVVKVYNDNDRRASDPAHHKRERFEDMLLDAARGEFSAVIVRHVDRLYRHPADLLRLTEAFQPHRVVVHQEWAGHPLDLSTPTGLLSAGIHAQIALYEIQHKKERQRAANEALLRQGKPLPGGGRPFGFNRDMTHRQDEAELIRDATQEVLTGASLGSVIRDWNARGIRSTRGGVWRYSNTRTLLMRWSNAGIRQTTITDPVSGKKTVVEHGPGTWEPIVHEDDFRALRALLCQESRIKHRGETGRKHLLSHVIRCGRCDQWMRAGQSTSRAGKRYPNYQCPDCRLAIDYEVAESVVINAVIGRLALPSRAMLELTAAERATATETHRRLSQITNDERLIESSMVSAASRIRQLESLQREREELQAALARVSRRMALAILITDQVPVFVGGQASFERGVAARKQARERFLALDLDRKRQIIRALLSVVIVPSPRGIRPTKETARKRVHVTSLDPSTGQPEDDQHGTASD